MKCPNGAGKTTFATTFIPALPNVTQFVNADLIACGLSPFNPESEAIQAGKLMLRQMDKLVARGESFCLETTLSGRTYLTKIPAWQTAGYRVTLIFLALPDAETAIARVAARVKQGGHHIPDAVVRRRFVGGLARFEAYSSLADDWTLYDNAGKTPVLLRAGGKK